MKKFLAIILFSAMFVGSTTFARGGGGDSGFYLGFNLLPSSTSTKTTVPVASEQKISTMNYDALFGYTFSNSLYLGAIMGSTSTGDTQKATTTQTGASLGFMKSSFVLMAHYFLSASTSDGAATETKLTNGSGIGMDLGYLFPVGNMFRLGAAIQYRSISYKKSSSGGTDVDVDITQTYYNPVLAFGFMF